jgi:hypothetical protein
MLQESQPRLEEAPKDPTLEAQRREAFLRWTHDPVTKEVIDTFVCKRDSLRAQIERNAASECFDDRQIRITLTQCYALSELIETLKSNE